MPEYIEREAACKNCVRYGMGETLCADCVVKVAPAADVAPVVHGRWMEMVESVEDGHTGEYYEEIYYNCLNCDYATGDKTPYCPNCGARMDGE